MKLQDNLKYQNFKKWYNKKTKKYVSVKDMTDKHLRCARITCKKMAAYHRDHCYSNVKYFYEEQVNWIWHWIRKLDKESQRRKQ